MKKSPIIGVCVIDYKNIKGTIHFYEDINKKHVIIDISISGLPKNSTHAFHVHSAGDLTDSCISACAHFNPYNKNHGGINDKERHVGDLGNIHSDKNGNVNCKIIDKLIKLRGTKANIIGRSIIIHQDPDDEGKGGHDDSLITGHAGKRIACAVIGYSKKMFS